ncbi:hypothetical protein PENCOP_c002G04273 [Penicillium coprophilum]|uniref:Uncharacterized protein n=1 Tax=Penicillium coprophilum TaxID=36646 RepID=A0A1V6V0K1_9EURO|nr:hypothetical protein PENCOP_c002G04273 [Penicillium coprophilum]
MAATLFRDYEITLDKPDEDFKINWGDIISVDFDLRLKHRRV